MRQSRGDMATDRGWMRGTGGIYTGWGGLGVVSWVFCSIYLTFVIPYLIHTTIPSKNGGTRT